MCACVKVPCSFVVYIMIIKLVAAKLGGAIPILIEFMYVALWLNWPEVISNYVYSLAYIYSDSIGSFEIT